MTSRAFVKNSASFSSAFLPSFSGKKNSKNNISSSNESFDGEEERRRRRRRRHRGGGRAAAAMVAPSPTNDDDEKWCYKLGLTGSIGTGKSTVSKMFREKLNVPVYDSDKSVHELYDVNGDAVKPIRELFGEDVLDANTGGMSIDRKRLGEKVLGRPEEMAKLEAIVHPLVEEKRKRFVEARRTAAVSAAADVLVFDVPLLFEKKLENTVDGILVVSCSLETQRERVMNRTEGAKMSLEKFEKVREMQMPDDEKRKRATWVVDTEKSLEETERDIESIVKEIRSKREKDERR